MSDLLLHTTLALGAVLLVMWGCARLLRRTPGGRKDGLVEVVARQQLGRSSSVAVVRVAGRAYLVGVTDSRVELLTETELDEPPPRTRRRSVPSTGRSGLAAVEGGTDPGRDRSPLAGSALSRRTWLDAVDVLRERTVRRA